jgi:hypothetical protein
MGIPAGLLNRRVSILRRSLTTPGYEAAGDVLWGGFRPRGAKESNIGGLRLNLSTGVLTLRDNAATRALSTAARVEVDGEVWEIIGRQIAEKPDGMLRFDVQSAASPAMYESEFESRGDVVTIRRIIANQPATPYIEARARAIITGYRPEEIAGGIQFGHSRIILSAADLAATDFPLPPTANDKIVLDGRQYNVLAVDANTHRIAGVLYAYEIQAAG